MKRPITHTIVALTLAVGAAACARTTQDVTTQTPQPQAPAAPAASAPAASAPAAAAPAATAPAQAAEVSVLDKVFAAITADKTIDSRNIEVDVFDDTKIVLLRGTVATEVEKTRTFVIARDNAKGYNIQNQLFVLD